MKRLILDIDDTLCTTVNGDYENSIPDIMMISKLNEYKELGFEIVLFTSRNMRTYEANVGKINKHTLPVLVDWLRRYQIPYDEIYVGKPWCGTQGFYVDDKAIRPSEFKSLNYSDIQKLINNG